MSIQNQKSECLYADRFFDLTAFCIGNLSSITFLFPINLKKSGSTTKNPPYILQYNVPNVATKKKIETILKNGAHESDESDGSDGDQVILHRPEYDHTLDTLLKGIYFTKQKKEDPVILSSE